MIAFAGISSAVSRTRKVPMTTTTTWLSRRSFAATQDTMSPTITGTLPAGGKGVEVSQYAEVSIITDAVNKCD